MRDGVASAVGLPLADAGIAAACCGCGGGGAAFWDVCSLSGMMPTCCGIGAAASAGLL
jgi:hypothetical protein